MNKIILSGNLCNDIEANVYNNKTCIKNAIAVKRDFKNTEGKYDTDFFNISLWGVQADYIKKYAKKGYKVLLFGRLTNNEYEGEDGTKKYSNDVQVEHIEILSSKKEAKEEQEVEAPKEETTIASIDDFLE